MTTRCRAPSTRKPSWADSSTHHSQDHCIPCAPDPPAWTGSGPIALPWAPVLQGAHACLPAPDASPGLAETQGTRSRCWAAWGPHAARKDEVTVEWGASDPGHRQTAPGHAPLPGPGSPYGQCIGWRAPRRLPPACAPASTCPLGRAAAVVSVHAVHAGTSVLAAVSGTVVDVLLAVLAGEACGTGSRSPVRPCPSALAQRLLGWTQDTLLRPSAAPLGPALGCSPPGGSSGSEPLLYSPCSLCDQTPASRAHR